MRIIFRGVATYVESGLNRYMRLDGPHMVAWYLCTPEGFDHVAFSDTMEELFQAVTCSPSGDVSSTYRTLNPAAAWPFPSK